ncbi:MAG: hypothetical protein D6738_07905 [Acidobacteria bacterium]|nr:MAG: hypothetical protein D6738_07905 [Acidobacteriota bacterium]
MKIVRFAFEVVRAALSDLGRSPVASLLAILAMGVAIFLLAGFVLVGRGVEALLSHWASQASIEVYLRDDAPDEEVALLARSLAADPAIRRVEQISRERALAEFRQLFPDLADIDGLLGENPLPRSLRLVPASPDPTTARALARQVGAHPAVDSVRLDREWIDTLARLGAVLRWSTAVGSLVLLLAGLTTIGSVVRLALDDKRDEVALMRLVGAPASFVLAPVLLSGALLGAAGAAVAVWGLDLVRLAALAWLEGTPLAGLASFMLGTGLDAASRLALLAGASAAGLVAAGLAAGRAAVR